MNTSTGTSPSATRRGVTEQAAIAAIDSAARVLRLSTIRGRFEEIAAAAQREQLTYLGFLAELVMAECDDRDRRRAARGVPPRQADGRLRLHCQPVGHPRGAPPAGQLRLGEGRTSAVPDR